MSPERFRYSEDLLQAIWKEQWFDQTMLSTQVGEKVRVLHPGEQNFADGPDFLNARVQIGGHVFAGAVEIHVKGRGWYAHGHHTEPNYEKVVLHVVAHPNDKTVVKTYNGAIIPTVNLLSALPVSLSGFLAHIDGASGLPCVQNAHFISKEALLGQIEKAHKEYLHQKVDDFFSFYDASLPPSQAWKEALIISLFDGFGISRNREPMQQVAQIMLREWRHNTVCSPEELMSIIRKSEASGQLCWNRKGVRPNHHPLARMAKLITLGREIRELPFQRFLKENYTALWEGLLKQASLHGGHVKILYGTVFIPAMYALGALFAHQKLQKQLWEEWKGLKSPVPKALLSRFDGVSEEARLVLSKKLGTVYQLKKYCNARRCSECEVVKKVIKC